MNRWPRSQMGSAVVAAASGLRTPLFASNFGAATGSGDTALTDGGIWTDHDGGTIKQTVQPSGGRFPHVNEYAVDHDSSSAYHWTQKNPVRATLTNGERIAWRVSLYQSIPDTFTGTPYNAGGGWAGNHPFEATYVAGGGSDSTNKWAICLGSDSDGTFPLVIELTGVAYPYNYICLGGAGSGEPQHVNKNRRYDLDLLFTRVSANVHDLDIRVYNAAGAIEFSTADGLNNIYGWGGSQFGSAGRNRSLAIDDVAVLRGRVGSNGGIDAPGQALVRWGMIAAIDDGNFVGPWGSLTTDV